MEAKKERRSFSDVLKRAFRSGITPAVLCQRALIA